MLVTAGAVRPRALLPTRGLGRWPSAVPTDTSDLVPQDLYDFIRKQSKERRITREGLREQLKSMLFAAQEAPETADAARTIEAELIVRRPHKRGNVTSIRSFVDYEKLLNDVSLMRKLVDIYRRLPRPDDTAIILLLLDDL